ncbi:terminase [Mycobacterium phage IdentityCrisis]|uniref:Terminase n=1 Tax=Mycobacterium phage IdentityCrisis TaxID=2599866 RepID=A0A5J6TMT2_9CAUD|nr:terminase [Mycobacterium phage IdentityCrisis]QFG10022.1 terminase [Mycobacterium phage IdentityCrisis]
MNSGTPRLSEVARHLIQPAGIVSTAWPKVRDTCINLGWGFDNWQDGAGRLILALDAEGLYAADTIVISIPRQVGKTYLVGAIVFALALIIPGLTVIWTAHRFKTARETFDSMKAMARGDKCWPHIDRISDSHGDEGIYLRNGSRILFGARENGFGLGFTGVGILILDEAQRVTEKAMDDLIPTMNTVANPLLFLMGTPPRPTDPGEVFTMLRQDALDSVDPEWAEEDNPSVHGVSTELSLYIELSADADADLDDRDQLRKANPSYLIRTSERAIRRMRKALSDDAFRREAFGIWPKVSVHQDIIRPNSWRKLIAIGPDEDVAPDGLAVDMSHNEDISVGAAWIQGSNAHVEEVWAGTDVEAAIAWIAKVAGRRIPVVIDDLSPAAQMIPGLKARKVKVIRSTARYMAKACLLFRNRSRGKAGTLTHANQDSVTKALKGARRRPIADAGGWGYDRRDSTAIIHPLVGVTLALAAATEQHRPATSSTRSGRRAVVL